MLAVFKREFKSYFSTPIGYIVLAAFYFFLGIYFSITYSYGSTDMTTIITSMSNIIIFVLPVLTMRLMSEDRRQKVDQVLITSPVKLTSIVYGKFLAAMAVFVLGFAPTIIFQFIIMSYVSVNITGYLYALLGMFLLGGTLIAIGMFISSLTESTVISAILTLVINILILYFSSLGSLVKNETVVKIIEKFAFINIFNNFGTNIFSVADIIYFLSFIVVFIFLCVRSLEKRRWS